MSKPEEDLLTNQMIQCARSAREAKVKFECKMEDLGKALGDFAEALQGPADHVFSLSEIAITVARPGAGLNRPAAHVTPAHINWADLCETLRGYNGAVRDLHDYTAKLSAIGVKLTD